MPERPPMPAPDYLLIGHMTADLTPAGRVLGGTVSYAARTAAAFGLRVAVLTSAVADDPLIDELAQYTDAVEIIPAAATSTFENRYDGDDRLQYIRGVAKPLGYADVPLAWRDAPLVHFAPLTGEINPAELFPTFRSARTMFTAQGMLRQWDTDGLVRFRRWLDAPALAAVDWLVLSEEDYTLAPELEQAYADAVANLVITRAERGGTYYRDGQHAHDYDTPQVTVTQPTGAGDVYAAALLCSLHLLDGAVKPALQVAAALGATAVTRDGWDGAPTPDEVERVLRSVKAGMG